MTNPASKNLDPLETPSAVLDDLGPCIPQVPVDFVIDHILPHVNCDVNAVKTKLENSRRIIGERWAAFDKDPTNSENNVFKALQGVFTDIVHHAGGHIHSDNGGSGSEAGEGAGGGGGGSGGEAGESSNHRTIPLFTYHNNPNQAPYSERHSGARPDGYFVRPSTGVHVKRHGKSKDTVHNWDDITVPAEFKKDDKPAAIADNTRKIFWSIHHIMRSDPCRRFMLGFTIENTNMRVFFCCRSAVFVTRPFNFILEHGTLIRFVTSVAYASEVDLGWDPTIHRSVSDNSSVRYKITVHQRDTGGKVVEISYLTTRLLYDSGAEALRGRGTRVFEAYRLEGDDEVGAPVAIKDVWLDDDRPREGATLTRLLEEASEDDKPLVKKYFLTVLSDGDVRIGNKVDNTRNLIMRQQDIPSGERFWLPDKSYEPRSGHVSDIGLTASWDEFRHTRAPPMTNRLVSPKTHYRIVFEEVCSPLHAVTTLQVAFQALCDGAAGLALLHKYQYIHRDVSCGNILSHQGSGKLSDLEYVRKWNEGDARQIRTGTIDFMSVEIESLSYHHLPRLPQTLDIYDLELEVAVLPFRYNPLHDVESIWWIGVWLLFCHRDTATTVEASLEDAQAQLLHVQKLFPRVLKSFDRVEKFQSRNGFFSGISFLPESFRRPAKQLELGRRELLQCFYKAEAGLEIDQTAFEGIDDLFVKLFTEVKDEPGNTKLFSLNDFLSSSKGQGEVEAAAEAEEMDISPPTSPTPSERPRKQPRVE